MSALLRAPFEVASRRGGPRAAHVIGLAIAVVYVAVLLTTSVGLGMNRDEGFYVDAAESYAGWFRLLLDGDEHVFERGTIDRFWSNNHEHPSLPKSLFALSFLAHQRFAIFSHESMAFRFPGMCLSALAIWVLTVFGARLFGLRAGVIAGLFYALTPAIFYHSHLDCFDTPIASMLVLVTYAYHRALTSRRWVFVLGVAYGLCLETKHNAWILPLVFLVHWLFLAGSEVAARRRGERPRMSLVPAWLLGILLIGPPIFLLLWPWMWNDTAPRIAEYVGFHVNHVHYNIAYLGQTYFGPPSPASYPWFMTYATVPLTFIAFALVGLALRFRFMLPPGLERGTSVSPAREVTRVDVLLFGSFFTPMFVLMMPWTPIFGSTKHFLVSYAFVALYAGFAVDRGLRVLTSALAERQVSPRITALASPALAFLLMLPPAIETAHSHPFGLSYYTPVVGGVPGAADLGMVRQFWGFTTGSLVPWMNAHVGRGQSVWICDTTFTAFRMLSRDGLLRSDIRASFGLGDADYAIVHHEDHFNVVDYQIWEAWGRVAPVYVLTYDGVPIVSVYRNPRAR